MSFSALAVLDRWTKLKTHILNSHCHRRKQQGENPARAINMVGKSCVHHVLEIDDSWLCRQIQ